tara:strand:+ start:503 stop:1252 length:750 start_codon:yes stop_codon:yes gene_type:complete
LKNKTISVEGLYKRYGNNHDYVFENFDLEIETSSFYGLLGPNGCGKTTLISIINGLLSAEKGKISINGYELKRNFNKIKPLIGLVPQEVALYSHLSFLENLRYFGSLYGLDKDQLKKQIASCLYIAKLEKFKDILVCNYSGGMKRRANLALSLIHKPKILFLDEPSVNVDAQSRNMIFEILRDLNQQGVTIFYTTHYLEEAQELCNDVAIMDNGEIIARGTPSELIASYPQAKNLGDVFLELTGRYLRD